MKNGQHHHEKLRFDVGVTCLVFSEGRTLNVVFYLKNKAWHFLVIIVLSFS